jgi:hypothetical protein
MSGLAQGALEIMLRVCAAIEVLLFGRRQGDCQTAMVTRGVAWALTMKSEGEGEVETTTLDDLDKRAVS